MKSNEEYRNSIDQKVKIIIQKRKRRNRFIAAATSAVACLVLIAYAVTGIHSLINKDSLIEDTGSSHVNIATGSKEEANRRQPFRGFVLAAYAANKENGTIAANFMSENASIVLQPNVEVLLGTYSPHMSSVPGFPFRFNTEDDCEIEVSVDKGILCRWDIPNGIVTQCGKAAFCAKGEILYWSPLTDNEESAEKAVITVTARDKGKVIGEQKISIISRGFIYSACMDELKIV